MTAEESPTERALRLALENKELRDQVARLQSDEVLEETREKLTAARLEVADLQQAKVSLREVLDAAHAEIEGNGAHNARLVEQHQVLLAERDAALGKAALVMEAFWLAIADLPHSDECALNDGADRAADKMPCNCWRAAADKVSNTEDALQLCTKLRDAGDALEGVKELLEAGMRCKATVGEAVTPIVLLSEANVDAALQKIAECLEACGA